jgi:TonB family protein
VSRLQNIESLAAARDLMRQGALFAPPGGHALGALLRIQGDAPDAEGLPAAWSEFRIAARSAIEVAAEAADWPTVEANLSALREVPEGAVIADQLANEFAARRLQERYLAEVIPATELKLLSSPPAAYPQEMLDSNIEGWVDVEFIVDRTGQPRDGVVADARPRGSFNAAALAALAQYRFAPFELDGRLYERRARLRIRFVIR